MAACSGVCLGRSLKSSLNTNHSPLNASSIFINKPSVLPLCSVGTSYSSVLHSDSRHGFGNIKSTGASPSLSRPALSASTEPGSISTGPSWIPKLEDLNATNMFLKQRIVFLGTQVDDMSADFIINQLLLLDAEDSTKDIKFFINSPGGSVTAGMGIYDAMKLCKADVSTICFGLAASMGAFLLASGTKGKRFCMPNCKVMLHQPYGGQSNDPSLLNRFLQERELNYHRIKFNKMYSRITGKPEEQIEKDTIADFFLNAWEAVHYGVADAVIDDGKVGLVAPIGEKKKPPVLRVNRFYSTVYNTTLEDYMKHMMPSEEKLIKKKLRGTGGSSGEKDSREEKDAQQTIASAGSIGEKDSREEKDAKQATAAV